MHNLGRKPANSRAQPHLACQFYIIENESKRTRERERERKGGGREIE